MTRKSVADEQYGQLWRKLDEVARRVDEGTIPFDETLQALQGIVEGRFAGVASSVLVRDMRKEGWTLLEHAPRRIASVADLELVPFLKSGENYIGGEELVLRARMELDANYGQEDAEWLLQHQGEISVEFRQFYLVLTATVWRDASGDRSVPCLSVYGD